MGKLAYYREGIWIEIVEGSESGPMSRCFRFDENGNVDYIHQHELEAKNPSPRWYGFGVAKKEDFEFVEIDPAAPAIKR